MKTDGKNARIEAARRLGYQCGISGEAPSKYTAPMSPEEFKAFQIAMLQAHCDKKERR